MKWKKKMHLEVSVSNDIGISPKVYNVLRAFQENKILVLLGCLSAIFWVAVDKILLMPVRMIEFNLRQKIAVI